MSRTKIAILILFLISFSCLILLTATPEKRFDKDALQLSSGMTEIDAYLGYHIDFNEVGTHPERYEGEEAQRLLGTFPPTALSNEDEYITIEFTPNDVPDSFFILKYDPISSQSTFVGSRGAERLIKFKLPEEKGVHHYIIRIYKGKEKLDYVFSIDTSSN